MLKGMLNLQLTAADPGAALDALLHNGITVMNVVQEDELTISFCIHRTDFDLLSRIAQKGGYDVHTKGVQGLYWKLRQLRRRPVLLTGSLLLAALITFLPSRILFIRVEGNVSVPTRQIIDVCHQYGLSFGASRKAVRSQKVKDSLLEAIPQLQWAGVNTSGCVATVTVRERGEFPRSESNVGVSSIVACRDGIITECTVTKGNPLCKVGQQVQEGELLVSGYTDCGLSIRAEQAQAEIFAQTQRQCSARLPTEWVENGQETVIEKKYAVMIGKKRINFYKGSGISGMTCDKMYSERYVTLPGGFQLPIVIVTETWITGQTQAVSVSDEEANRMLADFVRSYLRTQMVAGDISDEETEAWKDDGVCCLEGNYTCVEMIAQVRNEEIITPNGNDD